MRKSALALCAALALPLAACGDTTGERALTGGGIGAAVGAAGTALTGGCVWCGAAIGGGVGAGIGALTNISLD